MSARLEAILSLVHGDRPLFDLCCDHGQIGLRALERWSLPHLILVDQSAAVMDVLSKRIAQRGESLQSRITLLRQPAETLHLPEEACDIVIAGVGSSSCISIIEGLFESGIKGHRLILACQQKTQDLRLYLQRRQFMLVDEMVVLENGRFREIIAVGAEGSAISLYGERFRSRPDPISQAFMLYLEQYYAKIWDKKKERSLPALKEALLS